MRNKLLIRTILTLMIIAFMQLSVFASTLTLNVTTDKIKIKKGDEFTVKVSWDKGMQAADFSLKYDDEKMDFIESNLEEIYINNERGEVKTSWFSIDDTDITDVEYVFKAKKSGKTELSTIINGGFATGNLQIPEKYTQNNLTVEIQGNNTIIISIAIIVVILIILLLLKNRGKKKHAKKTR